LRGLEKWVETLVDGSDGALAGAWKTMEQAVKELSDMVGLSTLRAVDILGDITRKIDKNVELMVAKVAVFGEQIQVLDEKQDIVILGQNQILEMMKKQMQKQLEQRPKNEKEREKEEREKWKVASKSKTNDAENKKRDALFAVKSYIRLHSDWKEIDKELNAQVKEIVKMSVPNTGEWILKEEQYQEWRSGAKKVLWMRGSAGIGKTFLAQTAVNDLANSALGDRNARAYFFFREEQDILRSWIDSVFCLVTQIAEQDSKYCEQVAAEISSAAGVEDPWKTFFSERFPQTSEGAIYDGHAWLVLDGIDEMKEMERGYLIAVLGQIVKQDLNIHVLITSRPGLAELEILNLPTIDITKEKLRPDIHKVINAGIKELPRLNKFPKPVKKIIRQKIQGQADGVFVFN
jgi:hypothetical protein